MHSYSARSDDTIDGFITLFTVSTNSGQEREGLVQAQGTARSRGPNQPRAHLCRLLQPGYLLPSEWHEERGDVATLVASLLRLQPSFFTSNDIDSLFFDCATTRLIGLTNACVPFPAGSARVRRHREEQTVPTGWTTSSKYGQHLLRAGRPLPAQCHRVGGYLPTTLHFASGLYHTHVFVTTDNFQHPGRGATMLSKVGVANLANSNDVAVSVDDS